MEVQLGFDCLSRPTSRAEYCTRRFFGFAAYCLLACYFCLLRKEHKKEAFSLQMQLPNYSTFYPERTDPILQLVLAAMMKEK